MIKRVAKKLSGTCRFHDWVDDALLICSPRTRLVNYRQTNLNSQFLAELHIN